jgi:hypothetical protein
MGKVCGEKARIAQIRVREIHTEKIRVEKVHSVKMCTGECCILQIRAREVRMRKVHTGEVRIGEICAGEFRFTQVYVNFKSTSFFAPNVPNLDSLFENLQMLRVCHGSHDKRFWPVLSGLASSEHSARKVHREPNSQVFSFLLPDFCRNVY